MTRPEGDLLEGAAVLAQRDFAVGAAVQVVEHHPGHAALGHAAQVFDLDYARRCNGTFHVSDDARNPEWEAEFITGAMAAAGPNRTRNLTRTGHRQYRSYFAATPSFTPPLYQLRRLRAP